MLRDKLGMETSPILACVVYLDSILLFPLSIVALKCSQCVRVKNVCKGRYPFASSKALQLGRRLVYFGSIVAINMDK